MNSTITESATKETAGRLSKSAAYFAAFIALGLTMASLGPTLPGLAEQTRAQLSQISFLFTARSLGYLLGSIQGGRLYDSRRGHPVMASVLLLMVASLALTPLVPALWILTAIMLVLGIAEGVLDLGGNLLLVWVHRNKVGPFMNGLHFFFGVGAFLAPVIVAQAVLMSGGITWAYWALALMILPIAGLLLYLPSPDNQKAGEAGQEKRANPLLVALIAVFFFLYVGAEGSYGGWIFTYATRLGLGDAATAALLTSAFWGALTLGRLLAIPLAARFSPRTLLVSDLAACLVFMAVILLWPGSNLAVWTGTLGMGLAMASIFPTTISLAESSMAITGQATRWFFVGAGSGGMFHPWLIGQLFEPIGPQVTMVAILVNLVLLWVVLAALMMAARKTSR